MFSFRWNDAGQPAGKGDGDRIGNRMPGSSPKVPKDLKADRALRYPQDLGEIRQDTSFHFSGPLNCLDMLAKDFGPGS